MSKRRSRLLSLAALSIIAVVTDRPSAQARTPALAGKPVDACTLLTTAEAGELLKTKVDTAA